VTVYTWHECLVTVDEEVIAKQLAEKQQLESDTELLNQIIELSSQLSTAHEVRIYSVSQKKYPPKTFCYIFTQVKYISMKFCQRVVSSYLHIFTNFGQFILIFNKMALILLGVPIVFNVFSFKFHQVKAP